MSTGTSERVAAFYDLAARLGCELAPWQRKVVERALDGGPLVRLYANAYDHAIRALPKPNRKATRIARRARRAELRRDRRQRAQRRRWPAAWIDETRP